MPKSFIAGGDVYPSTFVKWDTTDGQVVAAGAGDVICGVAQEGTRRSPYVDSSGKAAASGEPIQVYRPGEFCNLRLAGTVTPGARLKSDASGYGVATTTNLDEFGARADRNGTSGKLVEVLVQLGQISS